MWEGRDYSCSCGVLEINCFLQCLVDIFVTVVKSDRANVLQKK